MPRKEIYLDYAAATPVDRRVKRAMEPYWAREYGNPSSIHTSGTKARAAIAEARRSIAKILGCTSDEIIFTSGATEADNLAVRGICGALFESKLRTKGHVVVSKIEHEAILRAAEAVEKEGHAVTYLDVNEYGLVLPDTVKRILRADTVLVSIGYANNEIGTIQPIAEIGKVVRAHRKGKHHPYFHTDASQAAGFLKLDVQKLGVDLMTLNSGKIYGPKGIGCLFVRRGTPFVPLIYGGGQERGLRSGTENVPGIVGFAKALEIAEGERAAESDRLTKLRDYFIRRLQEAIPDLGIVLNGHQSMRLPNNVHISIPGVEGEAAVLYLDVKGIRSATGAACTALASKPSHVILALGRAPEYAMGSLRFTLGRGTTKRDLDYAAGALRKTLDVMRRSKDKKIPQQIVRESRSYRSSAEVFL